MFIKKFTVAFAALFMLGACCACGETPQHTTHVDSDNNGKCDECGADLGTVTPADETFDAKDYEGLPTVQFSSIQAEQETGSCKLKMQARWTDKYRVTYSTKAMKSVVLYNEEGGKLGAALTGLKSGQEGLEVSLQEGQIVYVNATPVNTRVNVTVTAEENKSPLPFDLGEAPDPSSFKTVSEDPNADPLEPAVINYKKRENTLYVYCNAPEDIKAGPQVVNKCITRQPVSNQSVYFTYEQQTTGLKDAAAAEGMTFDDDGVYYGYRVTNTGKDDLYITVRNIGWQLDGAGAFLGEKEWIDFYNTRFELPDLSDLNESQKRLYDGYYGFSGEYMVHDFQPTTYRIPAGKYIYVMGGTTSDAFGGFSVGGTANRRSTYSTCANGAVLFDVVGEAEGAYYVYNDVAKVKPGGEGCDTHLGITDPEAYGVVHTGEDVGYVVDNQATWTFNDATPEQDLPVTYTNYYSEDAPSSGEPGSPIPNTTAHTQNGTRWATHLDVQQAHDAVGTDMTSFHTLFNKKKGDGEQKPITVGCNYYDTRGVFPNIGNWMKDYQDVFTFVNQGDKEREVSVKIRCTGAVVTMVRDMDGKRIPGTEGYSMVHGDANTFGKWEQGFDKSYVYTVKVPAHSVKQFVLEYNLMANSTGYVLHSASLK